IALEQSAQTAHTTSKWRVKNTIIVAGVLAIAAFLAGFLPSYAKGKRLENDLRQAHRGGVACHARPEHGREQGGSLHRRQEKGAPGQEYSPPVLWCEWHQLAQ